MVERFSTGAKELNDDMLIPIISNNQRIICQYGRNQNPIAFIPKDFRSSITLSTSERSNRFNRPTFVFSMCITFTIWQMLALVSP